MNKQMLKKLSAIALAVAMLQGVALTSAISYSAVETEQVEASNRIFDELSDVPKGVTVRYDSILDKYFETEFIQSGDYTYYVTDDGQGAVLAGCYTAGEIEEFERFGYNGKDKKVVIPSEIDGLPVVKLGRHVVLNKYCASIVIPSTVKIIESQAFECNPRAEIQLSEGVEEIQPMAFNGLYDEDDWILSGERKLVIPSSLKKLSQGVVFGSTRGSFIVDYDALVFPKNSQLDKKAKYSYPADYYIKFDSQFVFGGYFDWDFHIYQPGVLVPDDFDIISILPRDYSYIYYTEKNETLVKYLKNASKNDLTNRTFIKLELKNKDVNLKTNEEYTLKSNLHKQSLIDSCTWESSDTSVATVDEKGKVTAVGVGTATITMTTENEMQASCTVNVSKDELKITKPNLKVGLNQKYKLALNQTDVKGTWSSSDTSVATVNKSGNVTAVGVGNAMVTFTSEEGEKATCLINVAESKISDLGLSSRKSMKGLGRNYSLTPNDIRISGCTWKSSDTKVVTVNQYGIVKTVGVGTANVTVTDKFGNKFTCKVKVGI